MFVFFYSTILIYLILYKIVNLVKSSLYFKNEELITDELNENVVFKVRKLGAEKMNMQNYRNRKYK